MPIRPTLTIRLDPKLREGLEKVTKRDGITVGEQVRRAIKAWLKAKGIRQQD